MHLLLFISISRFQDQRVSSRRKLSLTTCKLLNVVAHTFADLRKSLNLLRRELDAFHETVDILTRTVTRLEDEVDE